jgi:hypothetical protein
VIFVAFNDVFWFCSDSLYFLRRFLWCSVATPKKSGDFAGFRGHSGGFCGVARWFSCSDGWVSVDIT